MDLETSIITVICELLKTAKKKKSFVSYLLTQNLHFNKIPSKFVFPKFVFSLFALENIVGLSTQCSHLLHQLSLWQTFGEFVQFIYFFTFCLPYFKREMGPQGIMRFYFAEKQGFTIRAEKGRDPKVRKKLCLFSSTNLACMIHLLNREHISELSGSTDNSLFKNWW